MEGAGDDELSEAQSELNHLYDRFRVRYGYINSKQNLNAFRKGNRNVATTRVYVQRIGVQKDKHSRRIAARFTGKGGAEKAERGDEVK